DGVNLDVILIDRAGYNDYSTTGLVKNREDKFVIFETLFENGGEPDSAGKVDREYSPEDRIYVYFTSGTTGRPKAIVGKNKSLVHFIQWEIETFDIGEGFRGSQFTTPGFDAFLRDVFVPLFAGGVVCIPHDVDVLLNAGELVPWLDKSRVGLIHCVPSLFRVFAFAALTPGNFKALKYILLSGEKIVPSDLAGWYETFADRIQLVNFYGPTETTMIKTFYFIRPGDVRRKQIPVGKPIKGSRVIILDSDMEICNKGIAGEIYIRTPYRTFGYYNESRLNRERFIPNPFSTNPDDIIYKTGDLGRLPDDGDIELLGRIDRQVKLHGVRVELEEIETILMGHPAVKEAAVIKTESSTGSGHEMLVAFVTEHRPSQTDAEGHHPLREDLNRRLFDKLPIYVTVAGLEIIEEIPRKPNRKVDYNKLPDLLKASETVYIAPRSTTEKKLSGIWTSILGISKVGMTDNFFQLGGSSLNVMALISKIHQEFDVKISLGEIFKNPIAEKQVQIIDNSIKETYVTISPEEKKEYYPLSHAQKRVWTLSQFEDASLTFNMPGAFRVKGALDKAAFTRVFEKLVERHESLRTIFITVAGEPRQRILEPGQTGFDLDFVDLRECGEQDAEIGRMANVELDTPFSLSSGPLLRAVLIRLEEEKHVFFFTMHHIVSDAVSMDVLFHDVLALYREFTESGTPSPEPLKIQYKDYTGWQNRQLKGEGMEEHRRYWREQLKGPLPLLDLPADKPRGELQTYNGEIVTFRIDEAVTGRLRALAEQHDVTLFMTLLTVLKILLYHYTGQRDVIVGTPAAGREHAELEGQVGFYINTLALRTRLGDEDTAETLLEKVKKISLEAFEHQGYPFDRLLDDLGIQRDISRHPIFDVVLDIITTNEEETGWRENNLDIEPLTFGYNKSKFDLTVYVYEKREFLDVKFEYNVDIFEENTIFRMTRHMQKLLGGVVKNPGSTVDDLLLDDALDFPPIAAAASGETRQPASYHQERLWFIDKFEAGNLYESSPLYHNVPLILEVTGTLDSRRLEQSIRETINRHAALRTWIDTSAN
ncbi:MAG: AMP-binding protein, partial [bacterium]|nr:AMP-binding protein [bacterium]